MARRNNLKRTGEKIRYRKKLMLASEMQETERNVDKRNKLKDSCDEMENVSEWKSDCRQETE